MTTTAGPDRTKHNTLKNNNMQDQDLGFLSLHPRSVPRASHGTTTRNFTSVSYNSWSHICRDTV